MISFCFFGGLYLKNTQSVLLEQPEELFFLFCGVLLVYAVGIWDDISELNYRYKFFFQFIAAGLMLVNVPGFRNFQGLFGLHEISSWVAIPLSLVLVVGVINAFNLIDGVDGLCSGLSLLTLTALILLFLHLQSFSYALLALCVLGVTGAFFMYNVFGRRLKIFMGDGGSLTLGYLVAYLLLKLTNLSETALPPLEIITPVTLLGLVFVPLFDMMRLFIARIVWGRSPFSADRNHIHHKFLDLGYSHIHSTGLIMLIQLGFMAGNFLLTPWLNINLIFLADVLSALLLQYGLSKRLKNQKIAH